MTKADVIVDRFHKAHDKLIPVMKSRGWKATWYGDFENEEGFTVFPESVDLKTGEVTIRYGRWTENKSSLFGVDYEELSKMKVSLEEFERMSL